MIDNRGVKVWPGGHGGDVLHRQLPLPLPGRRARSTWRKLMELPQRIAAAGIDIAKTETLRTFDGQPGYTLAQGQ